MLMEKKLKEDCHLYSREATVTCCQSFITQVKLGPEPKLFTQIKVQLKLQPLRVVSQLVNLIVICI